MLLRLAAGPDAEAGAAAAAEAVEGAAIRETPAAGMGEAAVAQEEAAQADQEAAEAARAEEELATAEEEQARAVLWAAREAKDAGDWGGWVEKAADGGDAEGLAWMGSVLYHGIEG